MLIRELLEMQGYQVAEAGNGIEALAYIAREPVAVLITDLYMPKMDGIELLRQIRRCGRQMPRSIAMSGIIRTAPPASAEAADLVGAHVILSKPFSNEDLLRAMETARRPVTSRDGYRAMPLPQIERRRRPRPSPDKTPGGLVQALVRDPAAAAAFLEADLAGGGNAETVGALLTAAERLGLLRGVDLKLSVAAVRARLQRIGYAV